MRMKLGAVILGGALIGAVALVPVVSEGRGGNGGRGRCGQNQAECRQQNPNCPQDGQKKRDGSCGNASCPQQGAKRDCPGPNGGARGGAAPSGK